jgi:mannose-1-phosphate guanylyltransferase/mannose-1-phosphate guanylyltransferase/mannose-6-phosphate isomerase
MFNDVLIMAGGSGTRLWPASSSRLPKQFLPANEKQSFFSMAVERALAVSENGRVIIIVGKSHIPHVLKCSLNFSAAEKKRLLVIGEPAAKNTAPAIACAVALSQLSGNSRNMLVLTSDHIIKPLKTFKADALLAAGAANDTEGCLTVFGIPPTRPDTGYGYIETDIKKQPIDGVYKVSAFHEKPTTQIAAQYVKEKRFFWNSGMFAFNTGFLAEQFRRLAPEVFTPFEKLKAPKAADFSVTKGIKVLKSWHGLENAYKKAQSISFDYAIAEKCGKTVMVKTKFDWIDIGNWEEYAKITVKNDSLVFNAPADNKSADSCHVDSDIPVALAGVEDLIVVIRSGKDGSPASALITKKGQTQKVRDIVEQIKNKGKTELL